MTVNSRFVVKGGCVGPPFHCDATEFWPFRVSGIRVFALHASAAISLPPVGWLVWALQGTRWKLTHRTLERGDV